MHLLSPFIVSKEKDRCLTESPFEMNVTDLIMSASRFFPADSWAHLRMSAV
jgi:hypothetical protein